MRLLTVLGNTALGLLMALGFLYLVGGGARGDVWEGRGDGGRGPSREAFGEPERALADDVAAELGLDEERERALVEVLRWRFRFGRRGGPRPPGAPGPEAGEGEDALPTSDAARAARLRAALEQRFDPETARRIEEALLRRDAFRPRPDGAD